MQKRPREEKKNVRRNFKTRVRFSETIKDGVNWSLEYLRLFLCFLALVLVDVLTGLRIELFYPFLVVIRACYGAFQKNHSYLCTLANQNQTKFSVLFLCMTATSDLVCYLFIPIHYLIFLASCYVWLSLIWSSYGGFLRAIAVVKGESTSSSAFLLFGAFFVLCFEIVCRLRCDLLVSSIGERIFNNLAEGQACEHFRGTGSAVPKALNAFFGAHCIGYPLILISYSLRYYFKEWIIRRRETEIARRNELYYKLLTEALPAVYEGPRDYSVRTPILEEECEGLGLDLQPMLMAPPNCNGTSRKSSTKMSNGGLRNRQSSRNKPNGQHSTPPQQKNGVGRRDDDDDDSDGSDEWLQSTRQSGGSISLVRLVWAFLRWTGSMLSAGVVEEDDGGDLHGDEYKKGMRNGDLSKSRAAVMARKGRVREKTSKDKVITAHPIEREKVCSMSTMNGGPKSSTETRDSSRDTSISTSTTTAASAERLAISMELERLKLELQHLRNAEQDARLQLSGARNTETMLRNENSNLKANVERQENKYRAQEKLRDTDRFNMLQLEKKYADLLNKKNDVERELMAERKARKDDGGQRTEEQLRERERELESAVDRMRAESGAREDRLQQLQEEVRELRKFKENNDSDVSGKDIEIKHLKQRIVALEESLQSENKLKQDLFRALGDARTHNAHLEDKLRSNHDSALSVSVHHPVSVSEKTSPTQQIPSASPPSYSMAMQHPKCDPHPFLNAAIQQHHWSPTGEHLLFEQSSSPTMMSPSCVMSPPHDRMGQYGVPTKNPTRIS